MTPATLQALRRLLFFSTDEAAELIGGVSVRSWHYWERGGRPIPQDVADTIRELVAWRQRAIDATLAQLDELRTLHGEPQTITLTWYPTREAWLARDDGEPPIYWRPHCSVVASVAAMDERVTIVSA